LLIARWRFVPVLMRIPCVILDRISNAAKFVVNGKNNLPKLDFSHKHIFMSFEVNNGQA
jgi:hypothetical protein